MHLIEPVHSGCRLFRNAADTAQQFRISIMHHISEIAAVVQNHVKRLAVIKKQCLLDAPIKLLIGHPLPGKDWHARLGNRGGRMVLRRKNIATAPCDLCAQLRQRFDENSGLNSHVQAAGHAGTSQWLRGSILLAQRHQARHLIFGQHDFLAAPISKPEIGNFVWQSGINLRHRNLLKNGWAEK